MATKLNLLKKLNTKTPIYFNHKNKPIKIFSYSKAAIVDESNEFISVKQGKTTEPKRRHKIQGCSAPLKHFALSLLPENEFIQQFETFFHKNNLFLENQAEELYKVRLKDYKAYLEYLETLSHEKIYDSQKNVLFSGTPVDLAQEYNTQESLQTNLFKPACDSNGEKQLILKSDGNTTVQKNPNGSMVVTISKPVYDLHMYFKNHLIHQVKNPREPKLAPKGEVYKEQEKTLLYYPENWELCSPRLLFIAKNYIYDETACEDQFFDIDIPGGAHTVTHIRNLDFYENEKIIENSKRATQPIKILINFPPDELEHILKADRTRRAHTPAEQANCEHAFDVIKNAMGCEKVNIKGENMSFMSVKDINKFIANMNPCLSEISPTCTTIGGSTVNSMKQLSIDNSVFIKQANFNEIFNTYESFLYMFYDVARKHFLYPIKKEEKYIHGQLTAKTGPIPIHDDKNNLIYGKSHVAMILSFVFNKLLEYDDEIQYKLHDREETMEFLELYMSKFVSDFINETKGDGNNLGKQKETYLKIRSKMDVCLTNYLKMKASKSDLPKDAKALLQNSVQTQSV